MSELVFTCQSFLALSFGAIAGSFLRMYLTEFFGCHLTFKHWGTSLVNIFASFLLGFFVALQNNISGDLEQTQSLLFLLVNVGFLGSLSTFSTFIVDLLNILKDQNWLQFYYLLSFSLLGGFLAVASGFALGNG